MYRQLPISCCIRNLDGKEMISMRLEIEEWEGEIPEDVLPEIEKLKGMNLEEQLLCCYVIIDERHETYSYGESESDKNVDSRVLLANYSGFKSLLVKEGNIVGFLKEDGQQIYPGQICNYYFSSETDGTGNRSVSSVSRFVIVK